VRPEGLGKLKKNHLIEYRTRDLPVCSIMHLRNVYVSVEWRFVLPSSEQTFRVTYRLKCTDFMLSWWSVIVVNSVHVLLSRDVVVHILDVSDIQAASVFKFGNVLKYIVIFIFVYKYCERKVFYALMKRVVFL
jgi:hypothetical protein